jgi:hypothetical protein
MSPEQEFVLNHVVNTDVSPYTTELLHPDGAFFALLCLASWILFLWLWAWNHKPRARGEDFGRRRPKRREIPWESWKN